jgi:hypothetical protein
MRPAAMSRQPVHETIGAIKPAAVRSEAAATATPPADLPGFPVRTGNDRIHSAND